MQLLAPGANTALANAHCSWNLESGTSSVFGEYAAVALLAVNEKRQPMGDPALLHQEQSWMEWSGGPQDVGCTLKLDRLPAGSDRVLLMVYVYAAMGPIRDFASLRLKVDADIEHRLDLRDNGEAAIIIGEFYKRNDQWKFRALSEGSAYGLSAFGRKIGLEVDDRHPRRPSGGAGGPAGGPRHDSATGTAFAVGPAHVMTCAHVIEDMGVLYINSLEGRYKAEPVVIDRRNDIALLRVQGAPPLSAVTFREGQGCEPGDTVAVLGYPLASISGGGLQVTQGGISGLFGLHNDASLFQFTAPIQPGSSGSPLFDNGGAVIGMVTSTVPDGQNMNFAVKSALLLSFLQACRINAPQARTERSYTTTEISRTFQSSLWLVEASRQ
ncbi:trypsin-like peptidase domain-containing protein [Pseudomonas syringae]|uniref:trypsin-like peptidase domain-containing protein n=1 Tax=Pseudomonas syringae TaxID=317 RepID=UPI001F16D1F3|nr:trypsin-like peptidase domain-containing protein [Pseudomonas syringae]MBL3829425.1 trypsin [Pseudomonas syringae pv. theae]MBL3835006.1 trypsin [Pseudomonas syringae pv. theae]MBL3867071.1 trypsin [Pseudomonas syringae pv. theae]GKQ46844.1 trypsin-like peptidase domain-containing protein [Pseudomonas syringae pv. theae]